MKSGYYFNLVIDFLLLGNMFVITGEQLFIRRRAATVHWIFQGLADSFVFV